MRKDRAAASRTRKPAASEAESIRLVGRQSGVTTKGSHGVERADETGKIVDPQRDMPARSQDALDERALPGPERAAASRAERG